MLVIFTDPARLAHSVTPETLKTGIEGDAGARSRVIGVGEQLHRQELTTLGRSGTCLSNNPKAYKEGFKEIGTD